ncbi:MULTISPECIES: hypothetical protein [unclassified Streptomyces]|uniref:hypothetical protein n=1 Tax=unclassified Streptomyces TaxID=2593676 RepID=UPI00336ABE29
MRSLALTFRMAVGVAAVVMAIAGPAVADQEDNVPARPPRHVHHVHHAHPRTVPADGAARHAIGGAEAYGLGLSGGTALAVAGLAVHRRRRPVGTASG